jgi:hypothetical protein
MRNNSNPKNTQNTAVEAFQHQKSITERQRVVGEFKIPVPTGLSCIAETAIPRHHNLSTQHTQHLHTIGFQEDALA